jgi:hypothetical protein
MATSFASAPSRLPEHAGCGAVGSGVGDRQSHLRRRQGTDGQPRKVKCIEFAVLS